MFRLELTNYDYYSLYSITSLSFIARRWLDLCHVSLMLFFPYFPVRGMFTLRTAAPVVTETLPIPRLCLTGRAPPRGTTVDLSHIEVVPNMNLWPLFHNGVAAGLRIAPSASNIDSNWIVFNKPKVYNAYDMI